MVLGVCTPEWGPPAPLAVTVPPRVRMAHQVPVGTFQAQLASLGSVLAQPAFYRQGNRVWGCMAKKEQKRGLTAVMPASEPVPLSSVPHSQPWDPGLACLLLSSLRLPRASESPRAKLLCGV